MKTFITRKNLEDMIFNTLSKGATMEEVHKLIDKLNIVVREGSEKNVKRS